MSDAIPHWSSDPYWIKALEAYEYLREKGQSSINIDLRLLEEQIFNSDSPAFKMIDAMCSVKEQEGWEGYRGAPRLVIALLALLNEQCKSKEHE